MSLFTGDEKFSIKFEPIHSENTVTFHKPKRLRLTAVILVLLAAVGCGTPGYIKAEAIEGSVGKLIKRHDAYVDADPTLSDLERRVYKRDGDVLKVVFAEAKQPTEETEEE